MKLRRRAGPGRRLAGLASVAALMSTLMSTLLTGCASPRQWALDQAAVALAAQGADNEDDLQLARDAAAYHLKLTESVLRQRPAHRALATAVSAGFTQYAYAFDADRVQDSDARAAKRLRERAARLYGRARPCDDGLADRPAGAAGCAA